MKTGNMVIKNLRLKKIFLEEQGLPFTIQSGRVHEIKAKIALAKMGTEPTEVSVEGINLLICKQNFNGK